MITDSGSSVEARRRAVSETLSADVREILQKQKVRDVLGMYAHSLAVCAEMLTIPDMQNGKAILANGSFDEIPLLGVLPGETLTVNRTAAMPLQKKLVSSHIDNNKHFIVSEDTDTDVMMLPYGDAQTWSSCKLFDASDQRAPSIVSYGRPWILYRWDHQQANQSPTSIVHELVHACDMIANPVQVAEASNLRQELRAYSIQNAVEEALGVDCNLIARDIEYVRRQFNGPRYSPGWDNPSDDMYGELAKRACI